MLKEQMEMFEEGGLKDDGGTVDPISGNDVPSGSTQEEVRDDIPAQLSEGEFVFPADVVRYIGLQNLMQMRQQAKVGLKEMEDMGQMGNSEEATKPDDLPFDINDIDMEDEEEYNSNTEMARGGVVRNFAEGGDNIAPAGLNMTERASTAPPRTVAAPKGGYTYKGGAQPETTTSYDNLLGSAGANEYRTYINDAGDEIQVPFLNGSMLIGYVLPDGYRPKTVDEIATPKIQTARPKSARVEPSNDDGDQSDPLGGARADIGGVTMAIQYNFDGTVNVANVADAKRTGKAEFNQLTPEAAALVKEQAYGQIAQIAKVVGLKSFAVSTLAEKLGIKVPGIDKLQSFIDKSETATVTLSKMKPGDIYDMGRADLDKEFGDRAGKKEGTKEFREEKDMRSIQGGLQFGRGKQINKDLDDDFISNISKGVTKGIQDSAFKDQVVDTDAYDSGSGDMTTQSGRDSSYGDAGSNESDYGGDGGSSYGDSAGSYGGMGDFNVGGLASKKKQKIKVKKMKRGGLASR